MLPPRLATLRSAIVLLAALMLGACTRSGKAGSGQGTTTRKKTRKPPKRRPPKPPATKGSSAHKAEAGPTASAADAAVEPAIPAADLPAGKPWARCDGDLSFDDIPTTPLRAVVAGKRIDVRAAVVRGSILGRAVAFDFAQPKLRWNAERPCFIAETRLAAGFARVSPAYAAGLSIKPGQYRLGAGWRAFYRFESKEGRRVERSPTFYGLLIIDAASGLTKKPSPMFTATGRVKGRVALCFKDKHKSFIAGSFDVPACGDAPAPAAAKNNKKATRK